MKKISFSNLLKALLLIVIGLVYAGQVSAEEPLPTADEIFIGLYDTHDYSGDALVYNNCWHMDTCTHFVGSDSVQPPSFACATEGDRYLRVVSECYSGLDETQRYIRGYGYIYTVNWDNDPLDCACQSPSNVWVDSATSCVSIGCNGGKCCGDDGSGDFWCGAGYTACESGTYYSGGDDNYLACECGKPLLQGSCNSPGETGCWDPGGGKCCGDDGVNDNWCTGMPNEGCVGGYFAYNQDNHPFLCENCGGNAWVASGSGINSRCCGDDIDDNWCGSVSSTTSKACNSGYYVNMDNEDDIAACLCALGYSDPSSADYGCGLTYSDCFYYEATSGCCGDDGVGELECYGTSDGCIDGNFYDDLDTQQTLCADCANGGWSSTATGTNTPCCGDDGASDSWCGTEDACFSGVYQSGGEAGCGCLIYGDQATDTCSVNGQTDCWDGVGCCYDVTSNWCTGIDDTYACHEGVWYNEPSSDSAACNCNSGRVWDDDNCQISGDGTEDCWANNSLDCCYGSNDKWCDGTAGACVGGTYRTNSDASAGACNCQGGHNDSENCQVLGDGAEDCWANDKPQGDCCEDAADNWCDGIVGACVGGVYRTDVETSQGACQCKGYREYEGTWGTCSNGQTICWASDASDCCDDTDDDWCDGTNGACVDGRYYTDPTANQGVCNCKGDHSYDDTCEDLGTGTGTIQDCWTANANDNAGDCCQDIGDEWCDGTAGACVDGVYQTDPESSQGVCQCKGDHDYWGTCSDLETSCWADGVDDCCYASDDDWCDGTAGACVNGVYQTNPDSSQGACQCSGDHGYSDTCSDGESNCWKNFELGGMDCCDGTDTKCDGSGNYAACINGIYKTDGDFAEEICSCGGGFWDIGGEAAGLCCGDDIDEGKLTRTAHSSMDNDYITEPTDSACCSAADKCIDDSDCYDSLSSYDADDDGDLDYCNAGIWQDCSTEFDCPGGYQCVSYNCVACIPGTCGASCAGNDSDYDGIIDDCDIEGSDDYDGGTDSPEDKAYYDLPVWEECNDGVDNDGDGGCDYDGCSCNSTNNFCGTNNLWLFELDPDDGCTCTSCEECGGDWWDLNLCDEAECNGCGNCHFEGILGVGTCCPDADLDGTCDEDDICSGFNDSDNADGDEFPDGCDFCNASSDCPDQDCSNDEDNDCSINSLDCYLGDSTRGDGDLSGVTKSCGDDDCYSGTYFKWTDCEENCSNGELICFELCEPADFPYQGSDADNDSYDDYCDGDNGIYFEDPCSREFLGDNCGAQICLDDFASCTNACPGDDTDEDGIPDECDLYSDDRDNDGTPDAFDCFQDDPLIGAGDLCGITAFCGDDDCYQGNYFDFTDCEEVCGELNDGVCGCVCNIDNPYDGFDDDNDGYDNYCDFYPNDPCSKETLGDNCSVQLCMDDLTNFCGNNCSGDDTDGDGATDLCDLFDDDSCSIDEDDDNCGGQNCLEASDTFCNSCSGDDADSDGIMDECDIETSEQDCNDGIDNDGDSLCDLSGCDGMEFDPGCSELCGSCEECGAGLFNDCTQTECEQSCGNNCYFSFGLGLFDDCCVDSDADTVCDDDELCPDQDDRLDFDGDGMPDACDYCENEPALTVPSEIQETTCVDGVDNDCDGLTDNSDSDCQCPGGTMRCSDGACSDICEELLVCNNNSICDQEESCNCVDCHLAQGSCSAGTVCDPETGLCSDEPDLTPNLCESYEPISNQGPCELGESNCWASEIPPDYAITGGDRCCGDDPDETWVYASNIDLEHVLVEYTCYEGTWRRLRDIGITYYDISVE